MKKTKGNDNNRLFKGAQWTEYNERILMYADS